MNQQQYLEHFNKLGTQVVNVMHAMDIDSTSTIQSVAMRNGEEGLRALFDLMMDYGQRMTMVKALNSPSIEGWVRTSLESWLYGGTPPVTSRLFMSVSAGISSAMLLH